MVKITTLFALAAVFTPLVAAEEYKCEKGYQYCGNKLLSINPLGYEPLIDRTLYYAEKKSWFGWVREPVGRSRHNLHHSLFRCSGDQGQIEFIKVCKFRCRDYGEGRNDWCEGDTHH
ncbi:hypothetical protein V8F20_008791 [Naviculisporaceae sp. PSN 640]